MPLLSHHALSPCPCQGSLTPRAHARITVLPIRHRHSVSHAHRQALQKNAILTTALCVYALHTGLVCSRVRAPDHPKRSSTRGRRGHRARLAIDSDTLLASRRAHSLSRRRVRGATALTQGREDRPSIKQHQPPQQQQQRSQRVRPRPSMERQFTIIITNRCQGAPMLT